jgi:hypothetical protein
MAEKNINKDSGIRDPKPATIPPEEGDSANRQN